jgi:glutamine amidotransferase
MCRWLAYSGDPVLLSHVLYTPVHSMIDQSLHAKMGAEATNGDGFGIGWYDDKQKTPVIFRSIEPAWNDRNLRELVGHIQSPLFFTHLRAAIGSSVQQTNCHPFRYEQWLFMHNGFLDGFREVKRDLVMAVDTSLFPHIEGQTDSEIIFYLALTFGLEENAPEAIAQTIGFIEEVGHRHGIKYPFQGTIAVADGTRLYAFRYSSEAKSRTLFFTRDVPTLRKEYPDRSILREASDETRIVVSEPIGDLPGAWIEMPESSYGVVGPEPDDLRPFAPKPPVFVG